MVIETSMNSDELLEILKDPVEREWVDFKDWIDLTETVQKAKIAADICGMANYGGGYLIFGISESGKHQKFPGDVRKSFSQDAIAGIVHKYLDFKIPCEVRFITNPITDIEHAALWIPSVAPEIVYSKADGPHDKGVPKGITMNTAYTRSAKPETIPINSRALMAPIIQRCMLSKRDELLGLFGQILNGHGHMQQTDLKILESFHNSLQNAYKMMAEKYKTLPPMQENFGQYSYQLIGVDKKPIPSNNLIATLEQANRTVKDTVSYGWSMFHIFTRQPIAPVFVADDNGEEFLQVKLLDNGEEFNPQHAESWRYSPMGLASIIRPFGEDHYPNDKKPTEIEAGKWLSPYWRIRDIAEVIRHARAMGESLDGVESIKFLIEWSGIQGRVFKEPPSLSNYDVHYFASASQTNKRIYMAEFSIVEIISNFPKVVSDLFSPFARLFDPKDDYNPERIQRFLPAYKR